MLRYRCATDPWCPRQESDLHLIFRRDLLYPLSYEDIFNERIAKWSSAQCLSRATRTNLASRLPNFTTARVFYPITSSFLVLKNCTQLSKNCKINLKGASRMKSKLNAKKFSLESPWLKMFPTASIGSKNISHKEL